MLQKPDQIIDVSSWLCESIYPVGAKPKRLLVSPETSPQSFIRPNRRYLYKIAYGWRCHQVWSEILAYALSMDCEIVVPRAYFAVNSEEQNSGVLVEWFGYRPREKYYQELTSGHTLLSAYEPSYGAQREDRPHSLMTNIRACDVAGCTRPLEWWTQAATFDALIGNTDRHPENWGLLRRVGDLSDARYRLSPIFDNGTSLGYEFSENNISNVDIEAYVSKGCHHMTGDEKNQTQGHFDVISELLNLYSKTGEEIYRIANSKRACFEQTLAVLPDFKVEPYFSRERAVLVSSIVDKRAAMLLECLQ
ncbi:HipA domain-containing protein [Hyphococcus flavus]|uniref:HipA domain-containing protein n=1 Tax=Hyphococcus flavus TaxID=1866326 RepID=A0AAE9ZHX9_9PROT|nr:HipA domain-containing protein [Hyphococcus flavus]WDI30555.1 HipA domain-containing protein [Hyphococcus flavus]